MSIQFSYVPALIFLAFIGWAGWDSWLRHKERIRQMELDAERHTNEARGG